jgi:hypothetical protein
VNDGLLFLADGAGNSRQVDGAEVEEVTVNSGRMYWLAADPAAGGQSAENYRGWKSGFYFSEATGRSSPCSKVDYETGEGAAAVTVSSHSLFTDPYTFEIRSK